MVLYLVCFDLGVPIAEQMQQIEYWLSYLQSVLCINKSIPQSYIESKWKIMIVGTRADLQPAQSQIIHKDTTSTYKQQFPDLPLFHDVFCISTNLRSSGGYQLQDLSAEIHRECLHILNNNNKKVPVSYSCLHEILQSSPEFIIRQSDIAAVCTMWSDEDDLEAALAFLQSIGKLVRFGSGKICIKPSMISQVLAKFVAPEEHVKEVHSLFTKTSIPSIFKLTTERANNNRYCITLHPTKACYLLLSKHYERIRVSRFLWSLFCYSTSFRHERPVLFVSIWRISKYVNITKKKSRININGYQISFTLPHVEN